MMMKTLNWVRILACGLTLSALLGGCDETRECLAYACSSGARMSATLPGDIASRQFELRLCHGDACADRIVTWNGTDRECDGDSTQIGDATACLELAEEGLRFDAFWSFGESPPSEKTFRLRIVDGTSGDVLLDETREAEFTATEWTDDCHDCRSATMDVNAQR